jgi:hypothetical protein
LDLEVLEGTLSVCRLGPGEAVPEWAGEGELSVTARTGDELSVVCEAAVVPEEVESSGPWGALRVAGTLDHALIGIIAALAAPLAEAEVPIFAISTFDTDYVLVPVERLDDAVAALAAAGHRVEQIQLP